MGPGETAIGIQEPNTSYLATWAETNIWLVRIFARLHMQVFKYLESIRI